MYYLVFDFTMPLFDKFQRAPLCLYTYTAKAVLNFRILSVVYVDKVCLIRQKCSEIRPQILAVCGTKNFIL